MADIIINKDRGYSAEHKTLIVKRFSFTAEAATTAGDNIIIGSLPTYQYILFHNLKVVNTPAIISIGIGAFVPYNNFDAGLQKEQLSFFVAAQAVTTTPVVIQYGTKVIEASGAMIKENLFSALVAGDRTVLLSSYRNQEIPVVVKPTTALAIGDTITFDLTYTI